MQGGLYVREHKGSLDESLATAVRLPDKKMSTLIKAIQDKLAGYPVLVRADTVLVSFYANDIRMKNWANTFIVSIRDYGVYGFTNFKPQDDTRANL